MKLFIQPSILNIFIYFSESKAHMLLDVLYVNKNPKKNIKLNFQNNMLNSTNLTSKLFKIGKDKIIQTVENVILNWLIHISRSKLHNYFIGDAF